MKRKIKYGKLAIVVFITVLIWVWADLELDEEYTVPTVVTINIVQSNPDEFWVSFNDKLSISLQQLILKGPASKIDKLDRELKAGGGTTGLVFYWSPEAEVVGSTEYKLDVWNLLRQAKQIRQRSLTIESVKPTTIAASVYKLVEKSLRVQCVDEDGSAITNATVDPATVSMFVPESWEGEKRIATVQLTPMDRRQARLSEIRKNPYIKLPGGQTREAKMDVKITLPPEQERLKAETISNVKHGFLLSKNLKDGLEQGKYIIQITNLEQVIGPIAIRATPEAKRAYENMLFQVKIEIDDSAIDIDSEEPIKTLLIYNFPPDYVRKGEIMLNQQPVEARFRLKRLSPAESGSTVGE